MSPFCILCEVSTFCPLWLWPGSPAWAKPAALIALLPERQRLAIFLRYYADLDYRSIAEALGVEVGTVSATLATAHASLRKALTRVRR